MRRYILPVLVALMALCATATAHAQTETIVSYELRVYTAGAPNPIMTPAAFAASATTCGVAKIPAPTGPVLNPTTVVWEDPADPTKDCTWKPTDVLLAFPAAGPLMTAYEATLVAFNAAGVGGASNRVGFTRLAPPSARKNLRLLP